MKRLSIGVITAGLLLTLGGCGTSASSNKQTYIKAYTPQGGLIYEGQGKYENSTGNYTGKGYIEYKDDRHVAHTLYLGNDVEVDTYVGK